MVTLTTQIIQTFIPFCTLQLLNTVRYYLQEMKQHWGFINAHVLGSASESANRPHFEGPRKRLGFLVAQALKFLEVRELIDQVSGLPDLKAVCELILMEIDHGVLS